MLSNAIDPAVERLQARRHKLTVGDFHRMVETRILDEDDRVELIEGELFDMAPIGSRHASVVAQLSKLLTLGVGDRALVFVQNPLRIPQHNEPLPDLMLLKPRADRYRDALPGPADVLLVVEVADTTVQRDRELKLPLYARHAIPEAWLVDVNRPSVSVFREPHEGAYGSEAEYATGRLSPGALAQAVIDLAELFG